MTPTTKIMLFGIIPLFLLAIYAHERYNSLLNW